MQTAFCRWYDKNLEDVTEQEDEVCRKNGVTCSECEDLIIITVEEIEAYDYE